VILEPLCGNMGVVLPEMGFLEMLREETRRAGALLIFDEVITGFRLGLSGAQGRFGIEPDLSCFGKVIGAGFPVAAVGGKKEILDALSPLGEVYQAGTLSGNPVAVAAGLAAFREIEKPGFYEALEQKAHRVTRPVQEAIRAKNLNACVKQCGSMFSLFFGIKEVKSKEDLAKLDQGLFIRLFKALFERGIYIPPSSHEAWFVSSAHTECELDFTANQIVDFILSI
jgi:glutamate-1-semialdehyde 2,1-aminomutase